MNKPTHISEQQIKKFLAGKLNETEKADFENFLAENPFEKEALEGLQLLNPEELEQDLKSLKNKIKEKTNTKVFSYRAIAASVAVLLGSIVLAIYFTKTPEIKSDNLSIESSSTTETNKKETTEQAGFVKEKILQNNENEAESKNDVILLKKERKQTPEIAEVKPEKLRYEEKPAEMLASNENKNENLQETSNEYKLAEKKEAEQAQTLPTQNQRLENTQNGAFVQTEKDRNLPTTANSQKKYRERTQEYPTFAPQKDSRALNKDSSYEYKSIYLEGKILDKQTKQALKNVKVSLKELNINTFSDSLGRFYFDVPTSGKYQLIFELPEYETMKTQAQAAKENIFYLKKQK